MVNAEHWRAAIACLEVAANDEREPDRYRETYRAALEAFRADPLARGHVVHDIKVQREQKLIRDVPGGGWRPGDKTVAIYCTGCPLRVVQPGDQPDVGEAVKQWEASNR
jgi:hypothetical protein